MVLLMYVGGALCAAARHLRPMAHIRPPPSALFHYLSYRHWAFYELCERWLTRNASLGATLLFATQPLFWGHAFISPKDIPFLTFFSAQPVVRVQDGRLI